MRKNTHEVIDGAYMSNYTTQNLRRVDKTPRGEEVDREKESAMKKRSWVWLTVVAGVMLFGSALMAGVPKGKETLKIDMIPGKKGAVEFPHAKHVDEFKGKGGVKIECKNCHHTATSDKDVKKCSDCHVKPGETLKKIGDKEAPALATMKSPDKADTKTIIFHKRCKDGCHKELKGENPKKLTSCKLCHK